MTFVLSSAQIAVPAAAPRTPTKPKGMRYPIELDVVSPPAGARYVVDELRQRPRLGHGRVGDRRRDAPGGHPRDVRWNFLGLRLDLVVEVEALQRDAPQTAVLLLQLEEPEPTRFFGSWIVTEPASSTVGLTSRFVDTGFACFGGSRRGPGVAAGALGLKKASMRAFFGGPARHEAEPARALAAALHSS